MLFASYPANSMLIVVFLRLTGYGVAIPLSVPLCGEPVALSVKVMVPVLVGPLEENAFVNLTVAVQLAAGSRIVPVQVSESLVKKNVSADPPVRVTLPVPVRLRAPVGSVMVRGLGVIETVPAATPVPVSGTGALVTATFPVM